jgi:1,4-alpha-glucan branching enzyme
MGEEFGAATPFLFFCDFGPELATAVTEGRRKEFARFARFSSRDAQAAIPDPNARETFLRSKLDWSMLAVGAHARWLVHYRELLALRQRAVAPLLAGMSGGSGRYTTCGEGAVVVEWTLARRRRLEIRLNLSGREARAPRPPEGEALYCEPRDCAGAFAAGRLPPAAAACYLAGAPA